MIGTRAGFKDGAAVVHVMNRPSTPLLRTRKLRGRLLLFLCVLRCLRMEAWADVPKSMPLSKHRCNWGIIVQAHGFE